MLPSSLEFCTAEVVEEHIFVVTLARPKQLNALHLPATKELDKVWNHFEANAELWVGILAGAGSAFAAGFDLKYAMQNVGNLDMEVPSGFGGLTTRTTNFKPIIAAVHGIAFGGGFELALACDIIIASEKAVFALPEPKVGLAALAGGLARLPRYIGYQQAMDIILTGRRVSAEEGYRLGFVTEVVAHENVRNRCLEKAREIMQCSPSSIRASKQGVLEGLKEASDVRAIALQQRLPLVKKMLSPSDPNLREGLSAFNQKRKPLWKSVL